MTFSQGDIIKFNAGFRLAVVISRKMFQEKTGQSIVCPITSKSRPYPTRIPIGSGEETKGFVICDHIKTIDIHARKPIFVERIAESDLDKILAIVHSEIEKD